MYQHYTTTAKQIGEELQAEGNLTLRQLWLVVRLAKLARRSCRHNTAFNSAFSAAFPQASFRQVTKKNIKTGLPYQGLQITMNNETIEDEQAEEE